MKTNQIVGMVLLGVALVSGDKAFGGTTFSLTVSAQSSSSGATVYATNTTEIQIQTNVTAEILYFHEQKEYTLSCSQIGAGFLTIQVNGVNHTYTQSQFESSLPSKPLVVGPAKIILTAVSGSFYNANCTPSSPPSSNKDHMLCTISTTPAASDFTANTGVVIPADNSGPVNVILESSVDLINWIPANPGTYGTSTTNRFFRVRATR